VNDRQQICGLTVEPVRTDTGTWWVWRNAAGRQIHAGLASRQLVGSLWFELRDGRWLQVREP